jgi:hypothetical protein
MLDPHEIVERQEMIERRLLRLPWTLSIDRLEMLLRALGETQTKLANLPPLYAASRFRESARRIVLSESMTSERLRKMEELAAEFEHQAGTSAASLPQLAQHFERAFFVFGVRRGGNHAIAEWLKGHFDERDVLHLNCAEAGLFQTRGQQLGVDHAYHSSVPLADHQSVLLVGYENLSFLDFPWEHNGRVARRSDLIVVLRDYVNMAASIARSARERPAFAYTFWLRDFPLDWAEYARHLRASTGGFCYIKFNDWFSDPEYRKSLSARLGLQFSDRGLNAVSAYGGGSSFTGAEMNGAGQAMNVLNRWEEMMGDDLFHFLLLAREENLAFNDELFGNFPYSREELLARWRGGQ